MSPLTDTALRDAHAVLFPAITDLRPTAWLDAALAAGTRAVVLGEDRQEYVARRMTPERERAESVADVTRFTAHARATAGAELVVAVDHEPWGTRRLQHLAPQLPPVTGDTDPAQLRDSARDFARAARGMGVTAVLSPVLDRLTGQNPWLSGRTFDADPERIGELAAAFVRGVQDSGVLAVPKHVPGIPGRHRRSRGGTLRGPRRAVVPGAARALPCRPRGRSRRRHARPRPGGAAGPPARVHVTGRGAAAAGGPRIHRSRGLRRPRRPRHHHGPQRPGHGARRGRRRGGPAPAGRR